MNPVNEILNTKRLNGIKQPTPFLAMDLSSVEDKYKMLKAALPKFDVYYAVKCNPEQSVLQALADEGSGFEVASKGELDRLISIGVDPKYVIYSNPVKPSDHIKYAFEKGLYRFAFDTVEELNKIAVNAPGSSVYLRMSVSNSGSLIDLSDKFGAEASQALVLFKQAEDLGLVSYGLTFHVGSQAPSAELWVQALEQTLTVINELQMNSIKLSMLNIGGGFPSEYSSPVVSVEEIGQRVNELVDKLPYEMKLICEPGRFLVAEAGVIGATVIGTAVRKGVHWVFTDVGRFQAFVELFESEELKYPVFCSKGSSSKKISYTITGPSCDSYDTIAWGVPLPAGLSEGDKIYFATAGAYTHVYGSDFNDFKVPTVIYV